MMGIEEQSHLCVGGHVDNFVYAPAGAQRITLMCLVLLLRTGLIFCDEKVPSA